MRNLCSAAVLLLLVVLRITPKYAQGDDTYRLLGADGQAT